MDTGIIWKEYDGKNMLSVANKLFPEPYLGNHNRPYDATRPGYLQPDPIGLRGGMNPYLYANANPVMFIDPKGLLTECGMKCVVTFNKIVEIHSKNFPKDDPYYDRAMDSAIQWEMDCFEKCFQDAEPDLPSDPTPSVPEPQDPIPNASPNSGAEFWYWDDVACEWVYGGVLL